MTDDELNLALATALECIEGIDHLEWPGYEDDHCVSPGGMWEFCFDYDPHPRDFCADGEAMLALIEAMRVRGQYLRQVIARTDGRYTAMFALYLEGEGAIAESLTRAVAIAAAKALGVWKEEA